MISGHAFKVKIRSLIDRSLTHILIRMDEIITDYSYEIGKSYN